LLTAFFSNFNTFAQTAITGCHCTANDVSSVSAILSKSQDGTPLTNSDCEAGTNQSAYVTFQFVLSANQRPGAFAQITYSLNDGNPQTIEECFPVVYSGTSLSLSLQIPDYVCGDKVTVHSSLFSWGNGSNQNQANQFCETDFEICKDVEPKCYESATSIVVRSPLIGSIPISQTCLGVEDESSEVTTLEGMATGGTPDYQFDWDLDGDGAYEILNQATVIRSFPIGNQEVTMRVTDSGGNTDVHEISFEVEACDMPVTLAYLRAFASNEEQTEIEWQTTSENQHAYFELEKSRDASQFSRFGSPITKPSVVAGNLRTYRAIDDSPFTGTTYYRLRQVDIDGTVHYSNLIATERTGKKEHIILSPNPVRGVLGIEVSVENHPYSIEILDITGRRLWSAEENKDRSDFIHQINTDFLSTGLYYVTVKVGNRHFFKRLIKH
jgi:hypothetical protein